MTIIPRDVETTLNYYLPDDNDELPYYYMGPPREGVPSNNVTIKPYPVVVRDARGRKGSLCLCLDHSGFQWLTYPSVEKEFVDEERIKTIYYDEVKDILRKHVDAKKMVIFDHTIRRSKSSQTSPSLSATERGPVHTVHVDQTPTSAESRVRQYFPDDAERLLRGRYQIINVWRPIANRVAHHPLGVADFRSVDASDVVPTRFILPTRVGETYSVKHNPRHHWYYLSDQTPDEVTLIKCFDSATHRDDGSTRATFSPHSAFLDSTSPADAPHRQSIEVRALVFDRE